MARPVPTYVTVKYSAFEKKEAEKNIASGWNGCVRDMSAIKKYNTPGLQFKICQNY